MDHPREPHLSKLVCNVPATTHFLLSSSFRLIDVIRLVRWRKKQSPLTRTVSSSSHSIHSAHPFPESIRLLYACLSPRNRGGFWPSSGSRKFTSLLRPSSLSEYVNTFSPRASLSVTLPTWLWTRIHSGTKDIGSWFRLLRSSRIIHSLLLWGDQTATQKNHTIHFKHKFLPPKTCMLDVEMFFESQVVFHNHYFFCFSRQ